MFCNQCGNFISDDSVFCSKCGAKIKHSNVSIRDNDSGELNREALKIYLTNVLSLECIRNKIETSIYNANNNVSCCRNNNFYKTYEVDTYEQLMFFYDGQKSFVGYTNDYGGSVVCKKAYNGAWYWLPIDENYKYLCSKSAYEMMVGGIFSMFENSSRKAKARDVFTNSYREFSSEAPGKYKNNLDYINEQMALINSLNKELNEVFSLLEKAYAVNIIPSTFRYNLHAIYYLYDFVISSSQSFTTALLHCDLDDIKIRLNTIIEQQKEIIVSQAIIMAQNNKMIKQNNQKLQYFARIERNTAMAAQYSQIAANNAEACAWIGVANYISKNI